MTRTLAVETLTRREFDCLSAVEALSRKGWPARIVDIARVLRVKPPSVVELVDRLCEKGMLERGPGGVRVSHGGAKGLQETHRSHRIFELMLTQMGMSPDAACRESKRVDRHPSRNLIRTVCAYLNHPQTCPHGEPIEPDPTCCRA